MIDKDTMILLRALLIIWSIVGILIVGYFVLRAVEAIT